MASEEIEEESFTREEAKRILRRLELEAYSSVITAFRAQGDLNREKKQALSELATHLSISTERHRAEVRRVVNDDSLNAVAECMHGIGTAFEWSIEGKRLVSLTPRLVPQTVFTAKATHTANALSLENSKLPAKKAPTSNTRERSHSTSSKVSEKLDEKSRAKDTKPPETSRSLSTSSTSSAKSQDGDKAKKKKKPNPPSNKVLKPSKLNLQSKSEFRNMSSPNLTKTNLLSPSSKMHKPSSPGNSHASFHQKPLILQRSPQKSTPYARSHSADSTVSSGHAYAKPGPSSQEYTSKQLASESVSISQQWQFIDNRASGSGMSLVPKSSHASMSSNTSPMMQKMKFKTPYPKQKIKPTKLKTMSPVQRPSNISIVGSAHSTGTSAESLNALATSTVVPMAPISPVKPLVPSGPSNTIHRNQCPVKVVQVPKSSAVSTIQSSLPTSSSKPVMVVSSANTTKVGNAQRVLALGNVPMSGNQQLKIASIPNVLQQSGAKIVSIAKSMPMTTGFKMIAVTTVVPGSTQVKTVYIATPIMSVTKSTTSTVQVSSSGHAATSKPVQAVVPLSSSSSRPAQTVVSPSNPTALGKPSLGMINSRGFSSVATTNYSSVLTASFSTANSASPKIIRYSTATVVSSNDYSSKANHSSEASKTVSYSKAYNVIGSDVKKVASSLVKQLSTTAVTSSTHSSQKQVEFNMIVPDTEPCGTAKPPVTAKQISTSTKRVVAAEKAEIMRKISENPNLISISGETSERPDESILLAGEKFLAELAAKFSKNDVEPSTTKKPTEAFLAGMDLTAADSLENENKSAVAKAKTEPESLDLTTRIQVQRENRSVPNSIENKVIVRKIGEEYSSPLDFGSESDTQKKQAFASNYRLSPRLRDVSFPDIGNRPVIRNDIAGATVAQVGFQGIDSRRKSPKLTQPKQDLNVTEISKPKVINPSSKDSLKSVSTTSFISASDNEHSFSNDMKNVLAYSNDVNAKIISRKSPQMPPCGQTVPELSNDILASRNIFATFLPNNDGFQENQKAERSANDSQYPGLDMTPGGVDLRLPVQQSKTIPPKLSTANDSHFQTEISPSAHKNSQSCHPGSLQVQSSPGMQFFSTNTAKMNSHTDNQNFALPQNSSVDSSEVQAPPKNVFFNDTCNPINTKYTSPLNSPTRRSSQSPTTPTKKTIGRKNPLPISHQTVHDNSQNTGIIQTHDQIDTLRTARTIQPKGQTNPYDNKVDITNPIPKAEIHPGYLNSGHVIVKPANKRANRSPQKTGKSKAKATSGSVQAGVALQRIPVGGSGVSNNLQTVGAANFDNLQTGNKQTVGAINYINSSSNMSDSFSLVGSSNSCGVSHPSGSSKKRKSDATKMPADWTKGALTLLQKVSRYRGPKKQKGEMNAAQWFTKPVNPADAPGYYKVIKKPMDFSTVKRKLEDGMYKDFTEFYADMHLIKANCYTYNPVEHIARKDCDLVFTYFEDECFKLLERFQKPNESPSKKAKMAASSEAAV